MYGFVRRKYQLLLITLILLVLMYPVLGDTAEIRIFFDLMFTVVFFATIMVLYSDRRHRILSLLLGIPVLVGTWSGHVMRAGGPREPVAIGFHAVAAVFLGYTVSMLMRKIYRERNVSADSVYGAFCGYLLIGLAFGHLYSICEWIRPHSFRADEAIISRFGDEWHRHFLLVYFSFVTLTTVGYGDMAPASDTARGLATMEAILGQFYIAVLVAELIGRRAGQRSGLTHPHESSSAG